MLRIFSFKTSGCGCGGAIPVVKRKQLTMKNVSKKGPSKKKMTGKSSKKGSVKTRASKKK